MNPGTVVNSAQCLHKAETRGLDRGPLITCKSPISTALTKLLGMSCDSHSIKDVVFQREELHASPLSDLNCRPHLLHAIHDIPNLSRLLKLPVMEKHNTGKA